MPCFVNIPFLCLLTDSWVCSLYSQESEILDSASFIRIPVDEFAENE